MLKSLFVALSIFISSAAYGLTATPTPAFCVGDCDGDLGVTADEVNTCIDILGGILDVSVCPHCDANSDGDVLVGEVNQAAANFHGVCPGQPTKTPTPSATPTRTTCLGTCCGDCNNDLSVSQAEVLDCVDIANGGEGTICNSADCDCDQSSAVTIDDLNTIIGIKLNGCPCGPTPLPTGSHTPTFTPTHYPTWTATSTRTPVLSACQERAQHNALPQSDSFFLAQTQNFMCQEDADRYVEEFHDMVYQGGFTQPPAPSAGLVQAPGSPFIATIQGFYVLDYSSLTFPASKYCWVIGAPNLSGDLGTFTRAPGTHYLYDCRTVATDKPTLPAGTVWLERVDTSSTAITSTTDLRTRVPWLAVNQLTSELSTAKRVGDLAFSQEDGCFYADTGEGWTALVDSRNWRAVSVTATWNPGSLLTMGSTTVSVSFTGVEPGFRCQAAHSALAGAQILSAYASGTDTVTVVLFNASAGTVVTGSGTLTVSCWQ